ncbi:MAG: HdeD family acid-resistance protein [Deltaproteobacteria bacterium]
MTSTNKELEHLANALVWRGAALLALGLAAVVWPEQILIAAMLAVGVIVTVFGLYEVSIAFSIRRHTPRWWLVLLHGVASIAFGGLSVGAPGVSLRVALFVIAAWFVLYAGVAFGTAILVWPTTTIRWALMTWAIFDVGLAILAVAYPAATIFALLFFGAVYAALFGGWQVAAGLWIRRALRSHHGALHEGRLAAAHS